MKRKSTKRKAFTLVELLVVVLIITMLAAFVAPRLFTGVGKTKADLSRAKMAIIENALARFYIDCGRYPDDSEGLEALVTPPTDLEEGKWNGQRHSRLVGPSLHLCRRGRVQSGQLRFDQLRTRRHGGRRRRQCGYCQPVSRCLSVLCERAMRKRRSI